MILRVVVTGSECTGKTSLALALAERYGAPCVPEYARQFVLDKGAAPVQGDVEAIARGQIALEDELAAGATDLLIQDTDLLSTVVYSRHYYGHCPRWIEEALAGRTADLYLLAGIDVPWVPDGDQRDRGDRREEMQGLFRQAIESLGARAVEVRGLREQRAAQATGAIGALLQRSGR